jgi:hypothetical protein
MVATILLARMGNIRESNEKVIFKFGCITESSNATNSWYDEKFQACIIVVTAA